MKRRGGSAIGAGLWERDEAALVHLRAGFFQSVLDPVRGDLSLDVRPVIEIVAYGIVNSGRRKVGISVKYVVNRVSDAVHLSNQAHGDARAAQGRDTRLRPRDVRVFSGLLDGC